MFNISYTNTKGLILNEHPKTWKYGFKSTNVDLKGIQRLIKSDYRCYSAGMFIDGGAVNTQWMHQDCIILDVDDGLTLEEAYIKFQKYEGLISTTKSHKPEHHKFRVILPIQQKTTCTFEEYTEAMRLLMDTHFTFVDKQCKDPARIYFATTKSEFIILDGRLLFDFEEWVEKAKRVKQVRQWEEAQKPERRDDGTKADWYKEHWKTTQMLNALNYHDKFSQGQRNGTLYAWAKYFEEMGFSDVEIKDIVFWLNSQGDGVDPREIERTIFRSMRI